MPSPTQPELLQSTITEPVIKSFFDTYNDLGPGFLESVYERALAILLTQAGLAVERQSPIKVCFRGNEVGSFRADIVVNQAVILELKTAKKIHAKHTAQLVNVMRATEVEVGLFLNFGPRHEFRRMILTNDRKRHLPPEGRLKANQG